MEDQHVKHIAIVGSGVSGLASIKSCLEEGIKPHCFEMNSDIGGLWYTPTTPKSSGGPQMYDSLITNTSKSMTCFSDFPCPSHYPPYLPHKLFFKYLQSYVNHFKLREHIQFNTKVVSVTKADDYLTSGRWVVTTETFPAEGSTETERRMSHEFDGVIVCQGFFRLPFTPPVPGLGSEFKSKVHHAVSYTKAAPFKDRTVVVVGSLSSAGDIAVDLAPVAKQVYLSVRYGAYIISRLHKGCEPLDFNMRRLFQYYIPQSVVQRVLAARSCKILDPVLSGLQPEPSRDPALVDLMINDLIPFKILTGQVKVVAHIEKLSDRDVHLTDGSVLRDVDDIVFATGYKSDFSLIEPALLTSDPADDSSRLEVYKMMFPLSLPHPTLSLIGFARIVGPVPPVLELQARLAARVMAGKHRLPDRSTMKRDIDRVNSQQFKVFGAYKYSFNALVIADMIAAELGVRPDFCRLLLQGDLKMALAALLGPAYPFLFRLLGPHPWVGAREATFNAYRETVYSMQHRRVKPTESKSPAQRSLWLIAASGLMLALLVWLWQGK